MDPKGEINLHGIYLRYQRVNKKELDKMKHRAVLLKLITNNII